MQRTLFTNIGTSDAEHLQPARARSSDPVTSHSAAAKA